MILFILGVITSTFTVDVGIGGHITTVRGGLLRGDISRRLYSGTELTKFDITVTSSLNDMSTIERTMMDESTIPNFMVEKRK